MASLQPWHSLPVTPIFPPWETSEWRAVNDQVRGGKSTSHLDAVGEGVRFWGELDITALGGAGFASQVHTFGPEPLHLPPLRYQGIVLHVISVSEAGAEAQSSKPHKPDTYTVSLKNVLPQRRPDGRNESVLNYECHLKVPTGFITIGVPWRAFTPTYRGRKVDPKDPMYKPFDSGSIVEVSLMCRSDFGEQAGKFDLEIESINGWLLEEKKVTISKEKASKPQGPTPTSLSHFVIFNPSLQPDPESDASLHGDEKDDAREAAQIIYYTSNEAGTVTRDKMLRQVGLAKGLMGFAAMVAKDSQDETWHAVRSHRQRLVLFEPEDGWWIHAVIANETILVQAAASSKFSGSSSKPSTPVQTATYEPSQSHGGLTDQVLRESLEAGHADFVLLNGTFAQILEARGRAALGRSMERFWTRWAWEWGVALEEPAGISKSLRGYPSQSLPRQELDDVLKSYQTTLPTDTTPLIISSSGPLTSSPTPSLTRYFYHILARSLPTKAIKPEVDSSSRLSATAKPRVSSWNPFGKANWLPGSTPPTPTSVKAGAATTKQKVKGKDSKSHWASLGLGSVTTGMESMGAVFGIGGGRETPTARAAHGPQPSVKQRPNPETVPLPDSPKEEVDASTPVQTNINVDDLEQAIAEAESKDDTLPWNFQTVWLPSASEEVERRALAWIMREDILLVLIASSEEALDAAELPTQPTLNLLATLSKMVADSEASVQANKSSAPSTVTTIHARPSYNQLDIQPAGALTAIDPTVDQELSELRGLLHGTDAIEVLARTQDSKFLAARQSDVSGGGEALVIVNRSDASIVDAEHALRVFARSHPDFAP